MNTKYKSTCLLAALIGFACHNAYADNAIHQLITTAIQMRL